MPFILNLLPAPRKQMPVEALEFAEVLQVLPGSNCHVAGDSQGWQTRPTVRPPWTSLSNKENEVARQRYSAASAPGQVPRGKRPVNTLLSTSNSTGSGNITSGNSTASSNKLRSSNGISKLTHSNSTSPPDTTRNRISVEPIACRPMPSSSAPLQVPNRHFPLGLITKLIQCESRQNKGYS